MRSVLSSFAIVSFVALAPSLALAEDAAHVTLRDQKFEPSTLEVKAGTRLKLTVTNAQSKAAEFESSDLNREKVIAPGSSATLVIGPLKAGSYRFFDDFNKSATGVIVAK